MVNWLPLPRQRFKKLDFISVTDNSIKAFSFTPLFLCGFWFKRFTDFIPGEPLVLTSHEETNLVRSTRWRECWEHQISQDHPNFTSLKHSKFWKRTSLPLLKDWYLTVVSWITVSRALKRKEVVILRQWKANVTVFSS